MANTQIIIDATDSNGRSVKKTVPNINPAATNSQLATFGNMFNQLTDNVYGNTTKITKVNCDTEANPPARFGPIKVYRLGDLENECTSLTFDELNRGWENSFFPIVYEGNSSDLTLEARPNTVAAYLRVDKVANGRTPNPSNVDDIDLSDLTINGKKVNYFAILEKDGDYPFDFNIIFRADDAKFTLSITNE